MATIYEMPPKNKLGAILGNGVIPGEDNPNTPTKISADNVIPTPNKQFLTTLQLSLLEPLFQQGLQIDSMMYKEAYDQDRDGIVDRAERANIAESILWSDVVGKPSITNQQFDSMLQHDHIHANKATLDRISVNGTNLLVDGHPMQLPAGIMYTSIYDMDNDGKVDVARYAEGTNWNGVINKPLTFPPSTHTHNATDLVGDIAATSIGGLLPSDLAIRNHTHMLSDILDFSTSTLNLTVAKVSGGNAASTYGGNSIYTSIQLRSDTSLNFSAVNPLLKEGEMVFELDTGRTKVGDGANKFNEIPYNYSTSEAIKFNSFIKKFISRSNSSSFIPNVTKFYNLTNVIADMFSGCTISETGKLITIPHSAKYMVQINTLNNVITPFATQLNDLSLPLKAFKGGAYFRGKTYCCPYNGSFMLVVNNDNRTFTTYGSFGNNQKKWSCACATPTGSIYMAPHNAASILVYDTITDSHTEIVHPEFASIQEKFSSAIYNPVDRNIYLIPKVFDKIVKIDTNSNKTEDVFSFGLGNTPKWASATMAANGLIYAMPSYGFNKILEFDPNVGTVQYLDYATNSYTEYGTIISASNKKLYCIPTGSGTGNILQIDIGTRGITTLYSEPVSSERWIGACLTPNGTIISAPFGSMQFLYITTGSQSLSSDIYTNNLWNKQ